MKVLFVCGFFNELEETHIVRDSIGNIHYSANLLQQRIIQGFKKNNIHLEIVSAPFVGTYPKEYKKIFFNAISKKEYVSFFNIWAIRNIFRYKSLKKYIRQNINLEEYDYVLIYAPHTPFLKVNKWIKKKKKLKSVLIVPDLPQYMNLNENKSSLYSLLKKVDIHNFEKLNKLVDGYVLLTESMNEIINLEKKKNVVIEAITEKSDITDKKSYDAQTIVYTGRLNKAFGIKELIDTFMKIDDQNVKLILCGSGDLDNYIRIAQKKDERIKYMGQLPKKEVKKFEDEATVLINPRKDNQEYIKYSFPSKNLEYLSTGNKTLCYKLSGIPNDYDQFLYYIDNFNSLKDAIEFLLKDSNKKYTLEDLNDFLETKTEKSQVKKIVALLEKIGSV